MTVFRTVLVALAIFLSLTSAFPNQGHGHGHKQHRNHARDSTTATTTTTATGPLVFAHFLVGIVSNRNSAADWDADMQRAKAYGIDAFALNVGTNTFTDTQLQYAYASAQNNGMKVFISVDFNWYSTGAATAVGQMIAAYAGLPAQLMVDGKVFVSSFGGDGLDVNALRAAAGIPIYFAPNFHPSWGTDMSVVDGALNWFGWPNNGNNRAPDPGQTGTVEAGDSQYQAALNGKGYIAPVSPWFFTHYGAEVSYSKNWLFPGDLLFYQRWNELLTLAPRFIEIVSWNDFGESHYVGPLSSPHTDDGCSKWINDMPHDGWLDMAKPFIAAYKAGATSVNNYITSDQLIYWYRPQSMYVNCDATDTCMQPVNNPDYYIGRPNGWQTVTDNVFVVAFLQSAGTLQVTSGNNTQSFNAPAGASSYSVPMGVGQQQFSLTRNSQTVLSATSLKNIINGCVCGLYNFNAYVGTVPDGPSDPLAPAAMTMFNQGLIVSTCSATASLGTAQPTKSSTTTTTGSSTTTTTSTTSTSTTISPTTSSLTSTSSTTRPSVTTSTSTTSSSTSPSTSSTTATTSSTAITSSTTSSTTTTPVPSSSTTSSTAASSTTSSTTSSSTISPSTTSSSTTSSLPTSSTTSSSTTTSPTTSSASSTQSSSTTSSLTTSSTTTLSSTSTSSTTTAAAVRKLTSSTSSSTTTTSSTLSQTTSSSSTTNSSTSTTPSTTTSTTPSVTTSTTPSTTPSTTSSTTSSTLSPTTSSSTTTSKSTTSSSASPTTTSSSTTKSTTSTTASTTPSTTPSTTSSTTASTTPSTTSSTKSSSTTASTTPSTTKSSTTTSSSSTTTPKSSSSSTTTTPTTLTPTTTTTSATSTATVCTSGSGSGNYAGLCSFCCNYGYCPSGPCTCNSYGAQIPPPPSTNVNGVPANGLDSSYSGLCSYACSHGYCPSGACRVA